MAKARKRFGQHFLEPAWVAKLVNALAARPEDAFVEIGPGRGAMTRPLSARVNRLLAIEVDRDLAAALVAEALPAVTVLEADVLDVDLAPAIARWQGAPLDAAHPVRVVGNLPYNISSPILFKLLALAAATGGVTDATLMLQREVADRLVAAPGTKPYGVLAIQAALHADVTRVLALPPGAFRPPPRVWSAVVRLAFRPPRVAVSDEAVLVGLVRSVFTQRRKTLNNALKPFADVRGWNAAEALAAARLDGRRRPETLQLVELARLADVFATTGPTAVL
ncbi:MAG: ribosomal RNA small subunit methyltransferase A [Acidobacteria bacterium]|nr:ribosomal RNA small subunit methyltransferase A [Acidobacteriota bacterium]